MIQKGFLGKEGFELSFGGWLLAPLGIIIAKTVVFLPWLLREAVLKVCASIEAGLGKESLSPMGAFSCRSVTSLD